VDGFVTEFVIILTLFVINGVLAMTEIALVSAKKARLRRLADDGDKAALMALVLGENPSRFLSTVQIGITLIGIVAGAYGGAGMTREVELLISKLPGGSAIAGPVSFVLVISLLTFLSLVIGELVPKRLAMANPEACARFLAPMMTGLSKVTLPFVRVLSFSTDAILAMLRVKPTQESAVSDEEVKLLIEEGMEEGVFREEEREMVEGILDLDNQRVGDLMTPRGRMLWLNINDQPETIHQTIVSSGHSHFPVYEKTRDQVIGMVSVKALWANHTAGGTKSLRELLTPPLVVPETMNAHRLIEEFRRTSRHIALVTDEYGGISGLVTLIDVMESIVGDLSEGSSENKPKVVKRADGSWLIDAGVYIEEIKEILDLKELPQEEDADYSSLGGFVVTHLGRIPQEGDSFEWAGFKFEVVDMDRHRLDKVIIHRVTPKTAKELKAEESA
jgi:putative hemolysin